MIEKHGPELINHSEFRLGPGQPYGKSYESTALGFRMKIHLYYDPAKALRESASLYELLESQENDLKGMEEPPDKKLHYDKYFYINRSKDGKLGFVRNYEAIDKELRTCGFFPNCGDRFQRKRRRRFWKSTAAGIQLRRALTT